jgi:hypothetical protein
MARHRRRAFGWIIIAALLFALAGLFVTLDVLDYAAGAPWKIAPLGQRWFEFHRNSLLLIQPAIERHVAVWLWPPVQWVLERPAWLVPGVLAVVILLVKAVRRR